MLRAQLRSTLHRPPWPRAIGVAPPGSVRSPFSHMRHRRELWQENATQRGKGERDARREKARMQAERARLPHALQASEARVHALEAQRTGLATRPTVDGVSLALPRFLAARLSWRAVSRGLALLAWALGLQKAPWPHTLSNGVIRRTIVRSDAARTVRGLPLEQAPLTNGLIWMIDLSIGLGSGKSLVVLALDAPHHQLGSGAPTLRHVHCLGVAVAESWTGDTMAEWLKRLIAPLGRPAASRTDRGSDRHTAAAVLEDDGLGRPCCDAISPAAAGLLKRPSQPHPACERFVSAWGRGSGQRKHTLLACWAPPPVRTKARCMHVHRLVTGADRLLRLSPSGGAKRGSMGAQLRDARGDLPDCRTRIKRFRGAASAVLAGQELLKTHGLGRNPRTQGAPCIDVMPTAAIRQELRASLPYQRETAKT
jgi:hypothetical protein